MAVCSCSFGWDVASAWGIAQRILARPQNPLKDVCAGRVCLAPGGRVSSGGIKDAREVTPRYAAR